MSIPWQAATSIVQMASYTAGAIAAVSAYRVYRHNARLQRATWVSSLYTKFFEQPALKLVRDRIDCGADDPAIGEMVREEPAELTDYLNFFEFVAYLYRVHQLTRDDVEALFGYYLACLKKHRTLHNYIQSPEKGYEYLRSLLREDGRRQA